MAGPLLPRPADFAGLFTAVNHNCAGVARCRARAPGRDVHHADLWIERDRRRAPPAPGAGARPRADFSLGQTDAARAAAGGDRAAHRRRHRRADRTAGRRGRDRAAAPRGQARPARARCARRTQDRPPGRRPDAGDARPTQGRRRPSQGRLRRRRRSTACSARSSCGSRSKSPRWPLPRPPDPGNARFSRVSARPVRVCHNASPGLHSRIVRVMRPLYKRRASRVCAGKKQRCLLRRRAA